MKHSTLFLASLMILATLGCDRTQSPTSADDSALQTGRTPGASVQAAHTRENPGGADNAGTVLEPGTDRMSPEYTGAAVQLIPLRPRVEQNNVHLRRFRGGRAIIRVPYDFDSIQTAVDAASPGDWIVVMHALDFVYNEDILIDQSKPGLRLSAEGPVALNGRIRIQADRAIVEGFNITMDLPFVAGAIEVVNASDVIVRNNQVTGSYHGIWLMRSKRCLVTNNRATALGWDGIILFDADSARVIENQSMNNQSDGIIAFKSSDIRVLNNRTGSNRFDGIAISDSCYYAQVSQNVCNGDASGITLSWYSGQNDIGPGNVANLNNQYGIYLYAFATGNNVHDNGFHCNVNQDIYDAAGGNTFAGNSTGPLPECQ